MRSVMKHQFSQVPRAEIPRSSFDRSHGHKTCFNAGRLIPFLVDEALPGDTFNLRTSAFMRLNTPIYPIMDNMFVDTHYFAVPIRLVWDNFQKMMGEQTDPGDSTDFLVPLRQPVSAPNNNQWISNTLEDYFGIPIGVPDLSYSALYARAYNLIWNEWFRDQNLQDSREVPKDDGPDAVDVELSIPAPRGKRHDYFTSALPWPQKGPNVELPLGTTAPVISDPDSDRIPNFNINGDIKNLIGTTAATNTDWNGNAVTAGGDATWNNPKLVTDLGSATAATINQIRQAFQIQKMYEKDARGGTRYTEIIRSHFGVVSPDMRLQRPEYLGGGSSPINITPIAQTTGTADGSGGGADLRNLGSLGAIGTASFNGHGFTKSFTEHCIIIGLVSVRADITYQQGLNRMFGRRDRFDFYWPTLSHIGEQIIRNKEIYAQGSDDPDADEAAFGYQERYAEYRYKPSIITNRFRSNNPNGSLDAWHLAQDFENLPVLGDEFIRENPPIDRIVATPNEPDFIADFYHKMTCTRPMPLYGVPGFVDRF